MAFVVNRGLRLESHPCYGSEFNPDMLLLALDARGFEPDARDNELLAGAQPSMAELDELCKTLDFPPEFFFQQEKYERDKFAAAIQSRLDWHDKQEREIDKMCGR